jgi:hypothetical protein
MMFIIDGTGDGDDKKDKDGETKYSKDMSRGFCYQLYLKLGSQAEYMRGPEVDGLDTFDIADKMLQMIMYYHDTGSTRTGSMFIDPNNRPKKFDDIFLAGHSRGGCAVIYIARKLKEKGINVKAMFLFDAVARTHRGLLTNMMAVAAVATFGPVVGSVVGPVVAKAAWGAGIDFDEIPDNVEKCYHAMRDRTLVDYYKKPLQLLTNRCQKVLPTANGVVIFTNTTTGVCRDLPALIKKDSQNRSLTRTEFVYGEKTFDFDNCGTKADNVSRLEIRKFKGHHGTMGGAITATSPLEEQRILAPNDAMLTLQQENVLSQVNIWMSDNIRKELNKVGVFFVGLIIEPKYALRYTKSANGTVC